MQEKLKVLIVDDEPDNLDLLYRTFRRDFKVYKAVSGVEALEVLEQQGEMAVIISDQRMPKMNGTEFLSYTVERYPNTIRIVLTGYTDVEDLVSAINAGKVFKYITKPWKPQALKETVIQAAQTYTVVKRRTLALSRALRQESLSNNITAAVRSSLDYNSTLQSVVSALGQAAAADFSVLYPTTEPKESRQLGQRNLEPFTYSPNAEAKALLDCCLENASACAEQLNPLCTVLNDPGFDLAGSLERSRKAFNDTHDDTEESNSELDIFSKTIEIEGRVVTGIVVPFVKEGTSLAKVCLYKETEEPQESQWADETIELLTHIVDQVALAISHAELYRQIQHQSMKMQSELEVARQIQSNLLHQRWPETPGLKIQARCQPAREVGGDFFEVFVHPNGDVWLAVGDVSGKGVPAALFMSSAISVLRRELAQENSPSPEQVMRSLNHSLAGDLVSSNYFITMALVRYRQKTGKLAYANAGHVYPVVWAHQKMVAQREAHELSNQVPSHEINPTYLNIRGVPLGILPNWQAKAGEIELSVGDIVLLTTDGIIEASVPNVESCDSRSVSTQTAVSDSCSMLNQEGLWAFLQEQPADFNVDHLISYIRRAEGEQEDDQTLLSLEVIPC
ncbi:MAG: SpoIIE family protein phosphatase [Cyanobacteria bacterium P01_D01_bin.1]